MCFNLFTIIETFVKCYIMIGLYISGKKFFQMMFNVFSFVDKNNTFKHIEMYRTATFHIHLPFKDHLDNKTTSIQRPHHTVRVYIICL